MVRSFAGHKTPSSSPIGRGSASRQIRQRRSCLVSSATSCSSSTCQKSSPVDIEAGEAQSSHVLPADRWRGEIEVRDKDGVLRRVESWSMELSAPPGAACAIFLRSAGDRSETEEAGARLFAIVASSTEAIIGTTLDGTITHWNPAAERLYGYRADEAIGRSVAMLAPPDLANDVFGLLERVGRGERIEAYETTRLTKDACRIEVSIGTSPVLDAAGNVVAASSIAHDVTERKRAERAAPRGKGNRRRR